MEKRWILLIVGIVVLFRATVFAQNNGEDLIKPTTKMPVSQESSFSSSANSSPVMPTLTTTSATDVNGKISFTFTSGTLFASQLNDLWARVTYDGKTEYWDLDPTMLAADGKSISMQFESKFDGKTLQIEFYGFDKQARQTGFANPIEILIVL